MDHRRRAAARARAAADYIPRGARVLDIGQQGAVLAEALPDGCVVVRGGTAPPAAGVPGAATLVGDIAAGRMPDVEWDFAVALGVLEEAADLPALLGRLSACGRTVIVSYTPAEAGPSDRRACGWRNGYTRGELAELVVRSGYASAHGQELEGGELLLRLEPNRPRPQREKTVWVLSCANIGNFGDRLGVHLLSQILPSHACVRHIYHQPFDAPPEGAPDLLIVGIGNSIYHEPLNDDLARLIERTPRAIGIFGTQYRQAIEPARMAHLLDRLHLWYARYEADALLFGRGRSNVRHLGDWLIQACPMARPSIDETLTIGAEAWENLPLDRYIDHIQRYRRVISPRLHPLLCALTSAEQAGYSEQADFGMAVGVSGKFRSMLLDVFGRELPPGRLWPVDRGAVATYKERVARNVAELREELARLLA